MADRMRRPSSPPALPAAPGPALDIRVQVWLIGSMIACPQPVCP